MARIPYRLPPKGKKVIASVALVALLGAGAASLSLDTVEEFEGYVPEGYRCPAGVPTKCWGDTTDVVIGKEYSFEECAVSLNKHLYETSKPIFKCVPDLENQPDEVKASAVSMAYNIGPSAFCKSSVARYFNEGKWQRGCQRMAEIYKTGGGKLLPGLVKRRQIESQMCLHGLEK